MSVIDNNSRPCIAVDFDATLCDSAFPACGPMMPKAKEALTAFRNMGFLILIYSCRTCHWHYKLFPMSDPNQPVMERPHVIAMKEWLDANEIPYDEIDDGSRGKPWADYYIDDKGVRFTNWVVVSHFIAQREAQKAKEREA